MAPFHFLGTGWFHLNVSLMGQSHPCTAFGRRDEDKENGMSFPICYTIVTWDPDVSPYHQFLLHLPHL